MISTLKQSYDRAVRWLYGRLPHKAPGALNELTLTWMDDNIGYPGIAKALLARDDICHDYTLTGALNGIGEDIDHVMRFQILRKEDLSRIVFYSGYADSHTGTVLSLKQSAAENYEIVEFYICVNGKLVETLLRDEESLAEIFREIPFILNLAQQNNRSRIIRNSWAVVKGGLTP